MTKKTNSTERIIEHAQIHLNSAQSVLPIVTHSNISPAIAGAELQQILHLSAESANQPKPKQLKKIVTKKTKNAPNSALATAVLAAKIKPLKVSLRSKTGPVKFAKAKISTLPKVAMATQSSITESYWERFSSIAFFALAGVMVSLAAWQLVELSLTTTGEEAAFVAFDARDYAAQQSFYTGQSTVINPAQVAEKVHAAAESRELSQLLESLGVLLILAAVAWWQYRCSGGCATDFQIRKIRN